MDYTEAACCDRCDVLREHIRKEKASREEPLTFAWWRARIWGDLDDDDAN